MASQYDLIRKLKKNNISIYIEENKLKYKAPSGKLSPELLEDLKSNREDLIFFLKDLDKKKQMFNDPIIQIPRDKEEWPLSFSQQSLWFYDQLTPQNSVYNVPNALKMKGVINTSLLQQTVDILMQRHEILRTTFKNVDGEAKQIIQENIKNNISVILLKVKLNRV